VLSIGDQLYAVKIKVELPKAEAGWELTYKDHKIVDIEVSAPAALKARAPEGSLIGYPAEPVLRQAGTTIRIGDGEDER
jgi:hypothetical protein